MPPGPDRLPLATSALRPWARKRGCGVFASAPPLAPLLDADGTLQPLRIYAYAWQHALALHFREIAAQWIAANLEKVRGEDPPLSDHERFGF